MSVLKEKYQLLCSLSAKQYISRHTKQSSWPLFRMGEERGIFEEGILYKKMLAIISE